MEHNNDPRPTEAEGPRGGTYRATDSGLVYSNGDYTLPLCNFDCRLLARVVVDDGAATKTLLELETRRPGRTSRFTVTAAEFQSLRWILDRVPGGVLWAGAGVKEHLRVAIQVLSRLVERRVYAHLGWREVDSAHVYLHSGGAIGCTGDVAGIDVEVSPPLDRFRLPPPPDGEALRSAVLSSLDVLRVAPGRVTVPMFAAVARSVIAPADFSLHVAGRSGAGKSQFVAVAQSFFGAAMAVGNDLPCSWASTANALEFTAFAAKDSLLVVDDFVPATRQGNETEMDRLLRGQGNGSGRARLGQASYYCRGLITSTGEALPKGKSLVARMVVLQMGDSLDWDRLTTLQQQARAGAHSACMAGFLRWLAPQLPEVQAWLRDRVHEVHSMFEIDGLHRRTSNALANLEAGFAAFLRFAVSVGALDAAAADAFLRAAQDRLRQCAADQLAVQQDADPARLFVARLRDLVDGDRGHLVDLDDPGDTNQRGSLVGWTKGGIGYVDPQAAMETAQAGERCDALAVSEGQLGAALHRSGLLARVDTRGDRVRFKVRLMVAGHRRQVWALAPGVLTPVAHLAESRPDQRQRPNPAPIRWDQSLVANALAPAVALQECSEDSPPSASVPEGSGGPQALHPPGGSA